LWDSISGEAGLTNDVVYGVERPGWLLAERMDHGDARETTLRVARALEREPTAIG
jgi:hypothetical protein